jgi:hypothetical protein
MKVNRPRKILVRQCVVLSSILAKDVTSNLGQAVTLRYQLYLLSSFLAMLSRKEVLALHIYVLRSHMAYVRCHQSHLQGYQAACFSS